MADWIIDCVLVACYALLLLAVLAVLSAAGASVVKNRRKVVDVKGVPSMRIAAFLMILLLVVLVSSFFFGSAEALNVNGREYADVMWLRLSDMFIGTVAALLVLAVLLICFGRLIVRK